MGQINGALTNVLSHVKKGDFKALVIKSTVPPSTTKEKVKPFIEKAGFEVGKDVGLANNPEFLREGYAWDDFVNPDRIVIGVATTTFFCGVWALEFARLCISCAVLVPWQAFLGLPFQPLCCRQR